VPHNARAHRLNPRHRVTTTARDRFPQSAPAQVLSRAARESRARVADRPRPPPRLAPPCFPFPLAVLLAQRACVARANPADMRRLSSSPHFFSFLFFLSSFLFPISFFFFPSLSLSSLFSPFPSSPFLLFSLFLPPSPAPVTPDL
jgi:hypothetical protein